jgi:hypothetical protein
LYTLIFFYSADFLNFIGTVDRFWRSRNSYLARRPVVSDSALVTMP